ncbi:MAG: aldo/keto reductase [Rhodobacteraceae bacterium]|nr:aldo/keto reductase [Paracoccaceae bacterium]
MQKRQLGADGPMVSAIGLGCMSFAGFFGETDEATSLRCLDAALDHGIDFLDTANIYGMGRSERVVGTWLASRKPKVVIATKASIVTQPERRFDNSEPYLRAELEASMKRLGVDFVDLFYIHRREQARPVEEVVQTLQKLITEGKIGGYGLSEISPGTLRRAHAVHPCRAVQNEYSLWSRMPELGLIQTCAELGVAFVPFSPLGRGVFGEVYPDPATMDAADFRTRLPRFSEPNYSFNRATIDGFKTFAHARGWTVAGAALAWVLDQGAHLIPIPGTRTAEHLAEWAGADAITLTDADRAEIARLLPVGFAHGDRYNDSQIIGVERYC